MPASTPWWSTPSTAAPRPGRRPTLGLAAAIVISVLSGMAMADPPPKLSRASADGYAMLAAPYGIDRGTCDRRQLQRDMAKDRNDRSRAKNRSSDADRSLVAASIGLAMDGADQACIGRILEYAPDRMAIRWYGAPRPNYGGPAYAVTPLKTFERDGQYCREYQAVGTIDGQTEQSYGLACRMPDGLWHTTGP
jgi:surface antigen